MVEGSSRTTFHACDGPRIFSREAAMSDTTRTQRATLGVGTLILIGLVALFFIRPGLQELEREMKQVRSEIGELKALVAADKAERKSGPAGPKPPADGKPALKQTGAPVQLTASHAAAFPELH